MCLFLRNNQNPDINQPINESNINIKVTITCLLKMLLDNMAGYTTIRCGSWAPLALFRDGRTDGLEGHVGHTPYKWPLKWSVDLRNFRILLFMSFLPFVNKQNTILSKKRLMSRLFKPDFFGLMLSSLQLVKC